MKKFMKISFFSVLSVIILLLVTCPDEEDYYDWLSEEHHISYRDSIEGRTWYMDKEMIKWRSKHVRVAGVFMQVRDHYEINHDKRYTVQAIGIFNMFFDRSSNG